MLSLSCLERHYLSPESVTTNGHLKLLGIALLQPLSLQLTGNRLPTHNNLNTRSIANYAYINNALSIKLGVLLVELKRELDWK